MIFRSVATGSPPGVSLLPSCDPLYRAAALNLFPFLKATTVSKSFVVNRRAFQWRQAHSGYTLIHLRNIGVIGMWIRRGEENGRASQLDEQNPSSLEAAAVSSETHEQHECRRASHRRLAPSQMACNSHLPCGHNKPTGKRSDPSPWGAVRNRARVCASEPIACAS